MARIHNDPLRGRPSRWELTVKIYPVKKKRRENILDSVLLFHQVKQVAILFLLSDL